MTDSHDIESTVTTLEGASNALYNIVQSDDIPIDCARGLEWLAWQIDNAVGDLRAKWDKHRGPKLEAVTE